VNLKKPVQNDASPLLLVIIVLILAAGGTAAVLALRADPIEESLAGDRVINTLFVIERDGKPLCSYAFLYYPPTRRAAAFDIPGDLGLILQRINRVDRIDTVYDSRNVSFFEAEIERLLGVDITFSVVITLEDLGRLVDLIEGVEIFIPAPVDVYQDEPILFPSGHIRLDGDKALVYVTYEIPEEPDDAAAFRRQRFFMGLLKRLGEQNEALKKPQAAALYQTLLKTGMNQRVRTRLFDEFARIDTDHMGMQSVGGNLREVSGQTLVFPFWDGSQIKDTVLQTLGGLIRPVEGAPFDRVYTVEVLNGTTVNGLAGRTGELLRGFGYDIIAVGNADRSDYETTLIIDRSGGGEAAQEAVRDFADIIRCGNIRVEAPAPAVPDVELDAQNFEYQADLTLVIGKDFNERYVTGK